ncbi:MAG: hypothetical protein PHH12_01140 [Candidatus Shapirobacteria bacterium]|jgi:hypothetical protein|nr:hypothetical protein [Candidatus Shapirobacteria bacterium]
MEKNNALFRIFIPIIAVIIIFESVMLVSGLEKSTVQVKESTNSASIEKQEVKTKDAFEVTFVTDSTEMKVGKNYTVKLQALVKEKRTLDAIDISVKYDAKNLEVTNLIFDEKLQEPIVGKAIKEDGMIVVKYIIETKQGITFNINDMVSLLSFDVKAKQAGVYEFEIATGNEDKKFDTMFIENTTVKALPFTSNKLEINVTK